MDPSVADGGEIVWDQGLELAFRRYDDDFADGESDRREIRFRIIVKSSGDPDWIPVIKFEIMDDDQLYFFVESVIDRRGFANLKARNNLSVDFDEFAREVQDLLSASLDLSSGVHLSYVELRGGKSVLSVTETSNMKSSELLQLEFSPVDTPFLGDQIQYRFLQLRRELHIQEFRMAEFTRQMRIRCPNSLKVITTQRKPGQRK
jgi:hypothetical protein